MIRTLVAVALLFSEILAQDPIQRSHRRLNECNVCLDPVFSITKPDVEIYTGQANKMWTCREFEIMASNGEFGKDVCSIVQGYALRDCGCDDGKGSPPPEQPVIDFGAICNVCGGDGGSDLDQVTNPQALVDTGVGIQVECGSLYNFGFQGAFTAAQCPTIQKTVRAPCGCGGAAVQPPTAPPLPETEPTGPPPTFSPPTNPPPSFAPPTMPPPTQAQATPAPTMSATLATEPPTESQATPPPTMSATAAAPPPPAPTYGATATPTAFPTSPIVPPTTQSPTFGPTTQTPPTYLVTASYPTAPLPTTTAPVATPDPTALPTTMPTKEPTSEPTATPCLEQGEACDSHADCCLGLCDWGICSIEVLTLTTPVTSSTTRSSGTLLLLAANTAVALILYNG